MNKIKIDINNVKKIITIDIIGNITKDNIECYNKEMESVALKLVELYNMNLHEWIFNIFTCHMIFKRDEMVYLKNLLDHIIKLDFKMVDVIIAKPQKLYKQWITEMIRRYYNKYHMKVLSSNVIFKFDINKLELM